MSPKWQSAVFLTDFRKRKLGTVLSSCVRCLTSTITWPGLFGELSYLACRTVVLHDTTGAGRRVYNVLKTQQQFACLLFACHACCWYLWSSCSASLWHIIRFPCFLPKKLITPLISNPSSNTRSAATTMTCDFTFLLRTTTSISSMVPSLISCEVVPSLTMFSTGKECAVAQRS